MDNKKVATKVFKAIKDQLTANKKNKMVRNSVSVGWDDRVPSTFNPKTGKYELGNTTYEIWVDGKKVVQGIESKNDVAHIFDMVRDKLNELKKTKGWGTLLHNSETIRPASSGSNWVIPRLSILTKVELPKSPCKEYKQLENYLNKYGIRKGQEWYEAYSMNLTPFRLYSAHAGGKRGELWGEEGDRRYLAHKPTKCAETLKVLRKFRTAKDKMLCKYGEDWHIDDFERRCSIYNETECDGEYRSYLYICIKSPEGKVKFETRLY